MKEADIMRRIQVELAKHGARLFRNNVGVLRDAEGHYVRYGLCAGSSDLIGWQPMKITPDMVGQTVAVFAAVEVKGPAGRIEPAQQNFIDAVKQDGGISFVTTSVEDALQQIKGNE